MKSFLWLAVIYISISGDIFAQEINSDPQTNLNNIIAVADVKGITPASTLQELLIYAMQHNPKLAAGKEQVKSIISMAHVSSSLPEPEIRYGYFINEVETRIGPQQHRVGISQSIPFPGKLGLKKEVALKAASADSALWARDQLNIIYQIKKSWHEYAYLIRATQLMNDNVQLLNYLEKVVRAKYRTGLTPQSSLLKVQIEAEKLRDRLTDISDMELPLVAQLNALLNRPPRARLPRPNTISSFDVTINDTLVQQQLEHNNPELLSMQKLVEHERAGINLAQKSNLPNFILSVDYIFTGAAINNNLTDSGKDPLVATVSMNLPLWWGKNKARVAAAQAKHRSAKYKYQSMRSSLFAVQQTVLYRLKEAKRKIDLYGNSLIPRMKQAYEVTRAAFEAGEVDFPELIETQRSLLEMRIMLARARTDSNQHLAQIEMLTATSISQKEN
ncbi:MAG: TolC family protein [Calditrichia bacterium]